MKRLLQVIIILLIAAGLAACSSPAGAGQSAAPSQTVSLLPTISPSPTPSLAPAFIPDTDIPDVVNDPDEISICSGNPLQEDDNYYYFSPTFSYSEGIPYKCIYCISKSDGSIKQVTDRFKAFTITNGIVYYPDPDNNIVYSYDTASGEKSEITTLKCGIRYLSYYDGRFYYLLEHPEKDSVNFCELCSCNKDWSDNKTIADAVSAGMFFLYKNKIYYEISPDDSSAYISVCSPDGSGTRQVSYIFRGWYEFSVKDGKLFYHDRQGELEDWTFNIKDIDTDEVTQLEDFDCFALLGQYVVYPDYDNHVNAYDITTGKTYKLFGINEGYINNMYTTSRGAYVSLMNGDNFYSLYKISISGGIASLEKVAEVSGGPDQ